ncbi:low molecular weight phosphatase family protein [Agrococcus sp. TSP3-2-1]|uniref:arsenate-mycothiol transferase ArsC n=1 Tax=Agrococcus sp. TSP3-2-1 TaxID=2804583 RepID=UPI003CF12FB4
MSTPTVLFLWTHNAGRSQLGAALLEHIAGDRYVAASAGVAPAETVNPAIAATVAEVGLDITDHVPRKVTAELVESADVVVAMKPGLEIPGTPKRLIEWSFPEPAAWDTDSVRPLREAVADALREEFAN